ncbi:MAG TPA: hypothetical protein VF493_20020 [Terriglobales bacterium]
MTFPKERLSTIVAKDVEVLEAKGRDYGDSWKKRGGVGAFMMLARKWDRIENQVSRNYCDDNGSRIIVDPWDIFVHADIDKNRLDGLLDDIRDLRRYLLLVEEEVTRENKMD